MTQNGPTVYRPCTEAGSIFRAGPKASRRCSGQGVWEEPDLTSCTIAGTAHPFLLVWFVIDADHHPHELEQTFVDSMKDILNCNGVTYKKVILSSVYIASLALTFQVDLDVEDQSNNVSRFTSFVSSSASFSSFSNYSVKGSGRGTLGVTVKDTCMCSSANLGSTLQLCSGAALSPCDCDGNLCSCQAPYFIGDGMSCTLDSDFDGYPDTPLDSPLCEKNGDSILPSYCIRDVCPNITNPEQNPIACEPNVPPEKEFMGCPYGPDKAEDTLPGANDKINDLSPELVNRSAVITQHLIMATDSTGNVRLLPRDLEVTNYVVSQVLNVLETKMKEKVESHSESNQELVDVFDNILDERSEKGWTQLQTVDSGSQTLLQNAERYGAYLASTVNDTTESLLLDRKNIVVTAGVVNGSQLDKMGNFSVELNKRAQIIIPTDSLAGLGIGTNGTNNNISMVHIIFRNIQDFLPRSTAALSNKRAESLVLSSQLVGFGTADIPDNFFRDNPIILSFSLTANLTNRYVGVFWNFYDPVGSGGWSSDGIQVISAVTKGNTTTVVCSSTHLTSFAVLVDVAGGLEEVSKEEALGLQVVSYIGCIISTISLSITVLFYLAMGRKLFSAVHYFVHLNLSIALLLGCIVFMFGIELGKNSKAGCGFVAALLQYLFLSAFCWMMCEGIMLYLMLIVVFTRLSNKWWFFMILGYCLPLLFVFIGLVARSKYYGVRGKDGELAFCWLSTDKGTIFVFVAPMIAIIVTNAVFLVLALKVVMQSENQNKNKRRSIKQAVKLLKAALILLPLLGVTWLFGLLTLNSNTTVFAWLFTIFNSLQGAAIFFFHVIRSKTVWSKISPTGTGADIDKKDLGPIPESSPNTASEGQSSTETMEILPNNRESGGGVRWLSDETNTNMGRKKDVYMKVVMEYKQSILAKQTNEGEMESTEYSDRKGLETLPEEVSDCEDSSFVGEIHHQPYHWGKIPGK
ncbi:Adhesion G protein-coupled receptor L1 [Geodia barretti]|uniref:Adhesion G protein-coupled receptor L1 n=1 Tax=Geodia barretti TaxID=519541 RepID=A0AA35R235_GEOBA|nr:Adhesion G protein-coupled receptor L1 [Geodia barretti]